MKKFLKITGIIFAILIVGLYLAFLFVLPNAIDLNKYKPEIQKLAKEQGDVQLNIQDLKLVTTPNLQAGIQTGNVSIMLPDNSTIFNTSDINLRVSIPDLLILKINLYADIENPAIDLDIVNGQQYKIVSHIENILNKNKEEITEKQEEVQTSQPVAINPEWLRIFAHININNYKIMINDIKSSHILKLDGENLKIGYFNNKKLKVKTNAKFYSDGENMINANIDINSFLPEFEPADEEEDDAVEVKVPFVNPVLVYRDYNLRADIDSKLKIREKDGNIKSWGYLNIENLTANLSGLQLPKSYLKFKTRGSKVETDTNLFFANNQNIKFLGKFDYLAPSFDLNILSEKIYINDVIILSKAVLDTLRIKNDLSALKGSGYFVANADIKTNFKKLKSNGSINVYNGKIASSKLGLVLDKMNINLNLDNNILTIPNSSANINGKTLILKGKIDEKSNTNIEIFLENLPLPQIYKVFAPLDIKKQYNLTKGNLTLKGKITGKLKELYASIKVNIQDLTVSDKAKNFIITNKKTDIEFLNNLGLVKNEGFNIYIPMSKSNISVPLTSLNINEKNITIPTSLVNVNSSSKLLFSGDIQNYAKHPELNFVSTGDLYAKDLRKFAGKDMEMFIDAKGIIPVEFSLSGNDKKQTISFEALSNANDYITPIHIKNIAGQNTTLKTVVNIRGNHIKIKDTGLFTRTTTTDEEGNTQVNYNPVLSVNGTIIGDYINKISIDIPKELNTNIYVFKNSKADVKPSKLVIYGDMVSPKYKGEIGLENLNIPELFTSLKTAKANFKDTYLSFALSELMLNGSDMNINGNLNLVPSKNMELTSLNIHSKYTDADKIMKVSEAAMKIFPQSPNSEPSDIPVVIRNGNINFKKIKSGTIVLTNTTSKIALRDNILALSNLLTHMCDGNISGRIGIDLLTGFMKITLDGKDLNTEKLLYDAAAMKDTLFGKTNFNTDITISGTTMEEQMKNLAGTVKFSVENGQVGPFGRLENMILAENIRESEFFKSIIGRALEPLLTIDTTHFSKLDGELSFKDGVVTIEPINSTGNILALNIIGKFNLLTNIAEMKVRSRLASDVSDMLGPIAMVNPINLVKNTPGLNIVLAKSFSIFCEPVTQEELDNIPDFAKKHSDANSTKFQIVLRGDVNKPFKLVKSFKWLATQEDIDKAQNFANELQIPEEVPVSNTKKKKSKSKE